MKVNRDRGKTWPVTGFVLGLVAVITLGLAYWSNVLDRERYFQSRNFRLLADLASQTSNLIENRGRIFRDTVGDPRVHEPAGGRAQEEGPTWQDVASALMRDTGVESDLSRAVIVSPAAKAYAAHRPGAQELSSWRSRGDGPSLEVSWVPPFGSQPALSMRLPASATPGQYVQAEAGHGRVRHAGARHTGRPGRIRRRPSRVGDAGYVRDRDSPDSARKGAGRRGPASRTRFPSSASRSPA